MTDTVIRVEGIGKLYRVGERESYRLYATSSPTRSASLVIASAAPRIPFGPCATFPSTFTSAKPSASSDTVAVGRTEIQGRIGSVLEAGNQYE